MRKMRHILCSLLAASLMTACSQDEPGSFTGGVEGVTPLVLTAGGLQAVATPASTRATVDGNWDGVQTVAVEVDGVVKEYSVSTTDAGMTATLSSTDPFYWTSREDITVSAWCPYAETMPAVVVKDNQSTKEAFEASDFISAESQTVYFDSPTLTFEHRTARVTVKLTPGEGVQSVAGAKVSLTSLGTDGGNPPTIITYESGNDTYEALTAPQTVEADMPFIQVELNGGIFYFRPLNNVVLAANNRYNYTISVTATGLELTGCTIGDWVSGGGEEGNAMIEGPAYTVDDQGNYEVYTTEGLDAWANVVRGGDMDVNCTLMADIDYNGKDWTPIYDSKFGSIRYNGTFDGQGYRITNLNIKSIVSGVRTYATMFAGIGSGATVKNLQLVDVTLNVSGDIEAAGIAGLCEGTVTACSVTGMLSAPAGSVGGIVARNSGTVTACWFNGNLTGNTWVGGIVARNNTPLPPATGAGMPLLAYIRITVEQPLKPPRWTTPPSPGRPPLTA